MENNFRVKKRNFDGKIKKSTQHMYGQRSAFLKHPHVFLKSNYYPKIVLFVKDRNLAFFPAFKTVQ